jgi:hypothetical protein
MPALRYFCLVIAVMALGCRGQDEIIQTTPPSAETQMLSALESHSQSGDPLGSGGAVIEEGIASVRERDPAKADALQQDYRALSAASSPAAVRAAAKTMLDRAK